MLYILGTAHELTLIKSHFPKRLTDEVLRGLVVLDAEYGTDRNYFDSGGYSIIIETIEDIPLLKQHLDINTCQCEWATNIGNDTGYISALYIINNDFTIMLYMPLDIAPNTILQDLED